ncbi:hypothetical protein PBI_MIMI_281 [Arthrobacter phage Mimi]|nr:hypothetical protein PBI_MIMI_75 [Arthrobacter phage Mimi]
MKYDNSWYALVIGGRLYDSYHAEKMRKRREKRQELEHMAARMLEQAEEVGYPPAELKRVPYKSAEYRMIKNVLWGALHGAQGYGRGRRDMEELRRRRFIGVTESPSDMAKIRGGLFG